MEGQQDWCRKSLLGGGLRWSPSWWLVVVGDLRRRLRAKEGSFCSSLPREGWYDTNTQAMLHCLDLSVRGLSGESPRNPMMQLKITALMAAELCVSIMGRVRRR